MRRIYPTDRHSAGIRRLRWAPTVHRPFFRPGHFARRCFLAGIALLLSTHLISAKMPPPEFGADPFPGGQPLGGGAGYSAGPAREQAVHQADSLESLQQALARAKAGEVVWIEGTVDFTGVRLEVREKITLAGDRGRAGSPGPLLFARHTGNEYFIQLRPCARLTGVRVRGSNPLLKDVDSQKNDPPGYAISCADAEVDNCEISQFQRGGVAMFRESERARIHHNHIHDIAAYPVVLGNGTGNGHVIEGNRIEWAWHAVSSNGSRGSGYVARHNEFRRVIRPALFNQSGEDPPNWCLDTHANTGKPTQPERPPTRLVVVEHNTFLADPGVQVGDGSDLIQAVGRYPKHDVYVGAGTGMTTTVEIRGNRFLMHEKSGSTHPFKPYGCAVRLVGLKGHPDLPDDPAPTADVWKVTLGKNSFSGAR